jgi:hypothetical protein
MKKLIILFLLFLVSCKSSKDANCDAYSQNKLNNKQPQQTK